MDYRLNNQPTYPHYVKPTKRSHRQAETDKNRGGYKKVYFCKVCRRAWQPRLDNTGASMGSEDPEYYPSFIMGDVNKVCPICERALDDSKYEEE